MGTFSGGNAGATPESITDNPPIPLPTTGNNVIQVYLNGGAGNKWVTIWYFVAP